MDSDPNAQGPQIENAGKAPGTIGVGRRAFSVLVGVLIVAVGYYAYAFMSRNNTPTNVDSRQSKSHRILQLDVLNGCGVKGVGAKFTSYLRSSGFDVVEMKNYKTFHIPQTLVVDRVGDLDVARRVAAALGVTQRNVIQQINPDYFVDVSVIIGEDFPGLRPSR